ncbi:MAG: thiol:disulfide interchange protein [Gammaproteobacteria bacterium RIFOXYA12_FULL_61_12]|nr:MAG: thiol:disulfide interchange protein [Gammaproteobacteria bacterium RIFOXYA12_FULL_61_12]OGT91729.1 MAG: thiol:disulfide interchange protein [Gammaproteobacteria bacterium RIFOXYD12_FULL_61_37]
MHNFKLGRLFALLLLLLAAQTPRAEENFLRPDEAYPISGSVLDKETVRVEWRIAEGYYLYKDKISVRSGTPGIEAGGVRLPPAETKQDQFFGNVEIYRDMLSIDLPLLRKDPSQTAFNLIVKSQGCADAGLCYPPHTQTLSLNLPPIAGTALPVSLKPIGSGGVEGDILPVEEAFKLSASVEPPGDGIRLFWQIAEGTYLYQEQIKVTLKQADGVALGTYQMPKPKIKQNAIRPDGSEGDLAVYTEEIDLTIPLQRTNNAATKISLNVAYQGCAEIGVCYPPQRKELSLDLPALAAAAGPLAKPLPQQEPTAEQDQIADLLKGGNIWLILVSFFGVGLLLALTPCVFPMIPILSGIIAGHGTRLTPLRGTLLSFVYVLAMAATYTLAGVLAGLFGENLQIAFQNPWILSAFALIFVLLALSMFGFYDMQLPKALQGQIGRVSHQQKGGTYTGVAVMGFLSALIVGPCVAPPLAGALIYIGQTGDALLGGLALFAMGMGMGAPLIVLGAGAGKLLPKAGHWMEAVKAVFGVLMLAVAILLLERILPPVFAMLLWGLLLICSGVYMGALSLLPEAVSGWRKLWKGLGLAALIYGALMLVGVAAGGKDSLQPLRGLSSGTANGATQSAEARFKRIKTIDDLNRELALASRQGKPVMLDFYATWCTYCVQFEKYVFTDPKVQASLTGLVLLQADVTANDEQDKALLGHFQIPAPPAILFFGADGQERKNFRVMGYLKAEEFNNHAQKAVQ